MYFTQEHEKAILDYCSSTCNKHRGHLYERWIQPAFDQMVDKIVFTYKFTTLPNIDELRENFNKLLIIPKKFVTLQKKQGNG